MYHEEIIKKRNHLKNQLNLVNSQLQQCPEGKLICTRNGKHHKWFQNIDNNYHYIPKKERPLAEDLAVKKYLQLQKQDLLDELQALDAYQKQLPQEFPQAQQLLENDSEYQRLLTSHYQPLSEDLLHWMNEPYEQNPNHPENKIFQTPSGHYVRSKSEALIAMTLHMYQIPFRYECALYLDYKIFYPDFTIRHPKTGELFYYEHFGKMDDPQYCRNTCSKLQTYTTNGIIPTINLITTFETQDHPLSPQTIQQIVETYFL